MKITQSWRRNQPSSLGGYSLTVTTTYSSSDQQEIDDLEKRLPAGMTVIEIGLNDNNDDLSYERREL